MALSSTPVVINLEDVFVVVGLKEGFDGGEHLVGVRRAKQQAITAAQVEEAAQRELEQVRRRSGKAKEKDRGDGASGGGLSLIHI